MDGEALGIAQYTSKNPVPSAQGMLHQDGAMKNNAVCMAQIHHVFVSRGENVLKMENCQKIIDLFSHGSTKILNSLHKNWGEIGYDSIYYVF